MEWEARKKNVRHGCDWFGWWHFCFATVVRYFSTDPPLLPSLMWVMSYCRKVHGSPVTTIFSYSTCYAAHASTAK